MEIFFLLFGVAAFIAITDIFSSGSDTEPEDQERITGTDEDDLIITNGGQIVDALDGDDTILSVGYDTIFAGPGDDILIALGAATMFGQEGEDIFAIVPETLDANDENWPVIGDFDPEDDTLVIDLTDVDLGDAGSEENPITLSGVIAPDGEGMLVQANGFNIVQLSNYGADDPQGALEALAADSEAFALFGAVFDFPQDPDALPSGVSVNFDGDQLVFALGEEFSGGGTLLVPDEFDPMDFGLTEFLHGIDLSNLSDDATITFDRDGIGTLTVGGLPPTTLQVPLSKIMLGSGDDNVDFRWADENAVGPDGLTVVAYEGSNDIKLGRSIAGTLILSGGENTVVANGGSVEITGGNNTLIDNKATSNKAFNTLLQLSDESTTVVTGGKVNLFVISEDDTLLDTVQVVRDELGGGLITWDGGSFETDTLRILTIQNNEALAA